MLIQPGHYNSEVTMTRRYLQFSFVIFTNPFGVIDVSAESDDIFYVSAIYEYNPMLRPDWDLKIFKPRPVSTDAAQHR